MWLIRRDFYLFIYFILLFDNLIVKKERFKVLNGKYSY